jgi:dolichol-phosphate mannosyltransferase
MEDVQISLVVPTYNERENITALIPRVHAVLAGCKSSFEIIIVDDDSPDRTWEVAQAMAQVYPNVRVIRRLNERGLARAVVRGWQEARGAILAVMDGDLQHPPETLALLIKALEDQRADIVVASRHVEGGAVSDWNAARRAISWSATLAATWMLPGTLATVRDPMSGYFVLRRSVIAGCRLDPTGYKILLEVLGRGRYGAVAEVPYVFVERQRGGSKLGPRQYWQFVTHLVYLAWNTGEAARFLRYCAVGGSGVLVNMAVFSALLSLGVGYLRAGVMAVEAAIVTNFLLNEFWVFADIRTQTGFGSGVRRFLTFNLFCLGGAVINVGTLWLLVETMGLGHLFSHLFGIALATAWNYGMNANITWGIPGSERHGHG